MLHPLRLILCFAAVMLCWLAPLHAQEFEVGRPIMLQATKPVGVPLHRDDPPNYWKHVPTDTQVILEDISSDGKWLKVRIDQGEQAWVSSKYIGAAGPNVTSNTPQPPTGIRSMSASGALAESETEEDEARVWGSREGCERVVKRGGRMRSENNAGATTLRVATWNIRWFPLGWPKDQQKKHTKPTDLDWLACSLIWMRPDVLTVQESLATSVANDAWDTLTQLLSSHTGSTWRWYRQPCGRPDDHHIVLLWNDDRVALSQFESLWQFNTKATSARKACTYGLRPGQYVRVKSRDQQGVDFHLISLHLKSGPTVFAVEERQKALNRIDRTVAPLLKQDQDVIILGDFNTMGAGDRHSQKTELKYVRRMVGKESPGFDDLPLTPQCSQYFRGQGGWLDHVLVTKSMKETKDTRARVTGYCGVAHCEKIKGPYPAAYRRLSDHCPVIIDILNQDRD